MKKTGGKHIRGFLSTIKSDIILLTRAVVHPKTSIGVKAIIVGMIIYIISPIDIIPDFIIGLGIIDDIGLIALVIQWIKKLIPERIQDEINGKTIHHS